MKKAILFFVIGLLGFFAPKMANASHVAGVDITYQCLGNDSFLITVDVFRDYSGATWHPPTISINNSSPCTTAFHLTLQTTNPVPGQGINVSQLCPTAASNCNPPGTNPGMQLFAYQAIVVLPPCNFWTFGYAPPCCRNNSLNITPN